MTRAPGRATRLAVLVAGGFALFQLGWILVMPPATGIDEFDHIYKASAVSMGHWQPAASHEVNDLGRGGFIPVRADLVDAVGPACARLRYTRPFNCRPLRQLGGDTVLVASGVDTYNPSFYAVAGTVARPFTGQAAIYVMRATTAVTCAFGIGLAVFLTMGWARTLWPLTALLLAALPTTVYSASLAAPNGINIVSGLVVWAALAALFAGPPPLRRAAFAALGVGVAVLANTHTLGIVWIGLTGLAVLACAGIKQALRVLLPRTGPEWTWLVLAVVGICFQLWWLLYARPNDPSIPRGGLPGSPWPAIANSVVLWPLQAIAAFPLRDEHAPMAVYAIAIVLLSAFVVVGVRALRGRPSLVRAAGVVALGSAAVPITLVYLTYHQFGAIWQGRYGMPFTGGLFLIAALALDRQAPPLPRPVLTVGVVTWGAAQVVALLGVLAEQRTDHHLIAATGWWAPPAVVVVVLGILATSAWLAATRPAASTTDQPLPVLAPVG